MQAKYAIWVILIISLTAVSGLKAEEDPVGKGSYMIGGMFGVAFVGGDLYGNPDDAYQIRIDLDWQRFFMPRLALGLRGLFDYQQVDEDKKTLRGVGPVAAYYMGLIDYNTYAFIEGSFLYSTINIDRTAGDDDIVSLTYTGAVGFAQFLVKNIALVGKLEYRHTTLDYDIGEDLEENEFGVAFGIRAFIY